MLSRIQPIWWLAWMIAQSVRQVHWFSGGMVLTACHVCRWTLKTPSFHGIRSIIGYNFPRNTESSEKHAQNAYRSGSSGRIHLKHFRPLAMWVNYYQNMLFLNGPAKSICSLYHGWFGQSHGCTGAAGGARCVDSQPLQVWTACSRSRSIFGHHT